jgi:hypothetical protein
VEWTFYTAFRAIGGESAVGKTPHTGRKEALQVEAKIAHEKKDL